MATVILRVPGYFILDYWYQNDVGNCIPLSLAWADVVSSGFAIFGEFAVKKRLFGLFYSKLNMTAYSVLTSDVRIILQKISSHVFSWYLHSSWMCLGMAAVIQGVLVLLLPLEQLVSLYMHYLTIAVLAAADTFSNYYIEGEKRLVNQWPDYGTVSFQVCTLLLLFKV